MPVAPHCSLKIISIELIKYYYPPLEKKAFVIFGCVALIAQTVISKQPWIYPSYSLHTRHSSKHKANMRRAWQPLLREEAFT